MTVPISIFTPEGMTPDPGAVQQMATCLAPTDAMAGVLSADHHKGYSMPIGGTIGYTDSLSPTGVGFDIGCGNKAVRTDLLYEHVRHDMPQIMDDIAKRISFGVGRPNNEPVDHPVFDRIRDDAPMREIRDLLPLAEKQLGTVGSGNHYVDLFVEEGTGLLWVGVHFGSRGFGHKIASGFMAMAEGKKFGDHASEGEMESPPILFAADSHIGEFYHQAMTLAGEYAYAGRDTVVNKVLEIVGLTDANVTKEVHNHHNFLWRETHTVNGEQMDLWVVRKGATPLFPGQEGFVGASMGENAVIIEGVNDLGVGECVGIDALWSAPHGAGRVMSRTEAKGKQRKRSKCNSCGYVQQPSTPRFGGQFGRCPRCESTDSKSMWVQETKGKVDWKAAKTDLVNFGVELRGGDADEAPLAYKRLPAVLAAHGDYVKITHTLRPVGVAMAGQGVKDPYKD